MSQNQPNPDQIRVFVETAFQQLGVSAEDASGASETVLIREGHYYGRCYRADEVLATLVAETHRLCFYNEDGTLLKSVDVDEATILGDEPTSEAA